MCSSPEELKICVPSRNWYIMLKGNARNRRNIMMTTVNTATVNTAAETETRIRLVEADLPQIREFFLECPELAHNFSEFCDRADYYEGLVVAFRNQADQVSWKIAESDREAYEFWSKQYEFFSRKAYGALCTADGCYSRLFRVQKVFKDWLSYKKDDFLSLSMRERSIQLAKMRNSIEAARKALDGFNLKDLRDLKLVV